MKASLLYSRSIVEPSQSVPLSTAQPLKTHSIHEINERVVWSEWLHGVAAWSLAVTITFKRYHEGQSINHSIAQAALRHTLRVLDVYCFGKRGVKQGQHVGSAAVISWGAYGQHPHAHLALSTPLVMTDKALQERFEQAADKTYWLARERVVTAYRDAGWCDYLIDHSPDNVVVPLLRPGSDPATSLHHRLVT